MEGLVLALFSCTFSELLTRFWFMAIERLQKEGCGDQNIKNMKIDEVQSKKGGHCRPCPVDLFVCSISSYVMFVLFMGSRAKIWLINELEEIFKCLSGNM